MLVLALEQSGAGLSASVSGFGRLGALHETSDVAAARAAQLDWFAHAERSARVFFDQSGKTAPPAERPSRLAICLARQMLGAASEIVGKGKSLGFDLTENLQVAGETRASHSKALAES